MDIFLKAVKLATALLGLAAALIAHTPKAQGGDDEKKDRRR